MQPDPLPIIKEFLGASDRQVRKNAVAAMAALETEEATVELVKTAVAAVKDQDPDTRHFAEGEILQLSPGPLGGAARELARELSDGVLAEPAYALLGRIRAHGVQIELPPLPLKGRLRLARSLIRQLYPVRGMAFRFRAMKKSLVALLIAVVAYYLISIGLLRVALDTSGSIGFALLTAFVGGVLAFVCTQRITPIGLQPDPKAAVLVQASATMVSSFVWILIIAGFFLWLSSKSENSLAALVLLALVPVACVVVRLVTISAVALTSGGWLNRYGPVIAGGCAGSVLITAAVLNRWLYGSTMIGGLWALLVPSMFGLAAGFAEIDQTGPTRRVTSSLWQKISYGTVIIFFLAIGLASRFSSAGPYIPATITDTGKPMDQHLLPVVESPTVINLTLNSNQLVGLQMLYNQAYCSASITDNSNAKLLYSPGTIYAKQHLPKGSYKLTANAPLYRVETPDDVLKIFDGQLMQRFGKKPQGSVICTIDLTLNRTN